MYLRQHEERISKMQEEVNQCQEEMESIFPKDEIVPLLILADMLRADELR